MKDKEFNFPRRVGRFVSENRPQIVGGASGAIVASRITDNASPAAFLALSCYYIAAGVIAMNLAQKSWHIYRNRK